MDTQKQKRSAFSGKIGFVLSAAGASVGLGNIWRFPYLAAKYGGGIFLLVYILLAVTFGYTMIVAETALGRMTHKSPVSAYAHFGKGKGIRFSGWINAIIPILIVPYYSVIGGWVIHYLAEYLCGRGSNLAADGYFSAFITNGLQAELAFLLFSLFTLGITFTELGGELFFDTERSHARFAPGTLREINGMNTLSASVGNGEPLLRYIRQWVIFLEQHPEMGK